MAASGQGGVEAVYADENVWLTQKMMGLLYDVDVRTISYITNPDKEIVALCEITKALHGPPGQEKIEFRKIEQFAEPVTWDELQAVPALAQCEPILSNQGSLFAVTADEYDAIRALIDARNVGIQPPQIAPFTKEDALTGLFMSPDELDTILARLKRKKALILQGPPGVGKTFIARRLAFTLMGKRDERRVAMVQFHPSCRMAQGAQRVRRVDRTDSREGRNLERGD